MKPRVYIAGPMTGIPQFNFPAFDEAAAALRSNGYDVVSPAEMDDPETRAAALASPDGSMETMKRHGTWGSFLARDVLLIADGGIEEVWVLRGWEKSRGARLETFVAVLCGLPIYDYDTLYVLPGHVLVKAWAGALWDDVLRHARTRFFSAIRDLMPKVDL